MSTDYLNLRSCFTRWRQGIPTPFQVEVMALVAERDALLAEHDARRWVAVEDRLPTTDDAVDEFILVLAEDGRAHMTSYRDLPQPWITHWASIVAPPAPTEEVIAPARDDRV